MADNSTFDSRTFLRQEIDDLDRQIEDFDVGGMEMDDELLELFMTQFKDIAEAARKAVDTSEMQSLARNGHSLKGMGGSVSLPEISVLGRSLEQSAIAEDTGRCLVLVNLLENWLLQFGGKAT